MPVRASRTRWSVPRPGIIVRRLAPFLLVAALAAALVPSPVAAVQAPSSPEARLLSLLNAERARAGQVALRWDNRLADVAQGRSDEMARTGLFSHIDWAILAQRIEAEGIAWYYLGETIMHGTPRTAMESADEAMSVWRNSPGHWTLLGSADFNYVAVAVTQAADGRYYWTALLLKGPDRTAPSASMSGANSATLVTSTKRSVTVSWSGRDVQLSVLTAGLRDYRLQRRVGSGSWVTVTDWTTATSRSFSLTVGHNYRVRVRARDHKGNVSTWSPAVLVTP